MARGGDGSRCRRRCAVAYNSSSNGAALGAGLVGALAGVAADAMIEDTNYTMITDLQIAEKPWRVSP